MGDGGVATEVRPAEIPHKPREIKIINPQRQALEKLQAEQAALIARGEDRAREAAEKVRQELEAEASKAGETTRPSVPETTSVYTHGVKIHVHPGETSFDPLTKKPTIKSS